MSHSPAQPVVTWAELLSEHAPWLKTVLLARVRCPHEAEDLWQEVSLAALRKDSCAVRNVAPWLYRLAVRAVLMHRRRTGRRRRHERHSWQFATAPHDACRDEPSRWLISEERRALLNSAIQQLPAQETEILLLKYTENWSYRQISEHLGLSIEAVESRLTRARHRLRNRLQANECERAGDD